MSKSRKNFDSVKVINPEDDESDDLEIVSEILPTPSKNSFSDVIETEDLEILYDLNETEEKVMAEKFEDEIKENGDYCG